MNIFKRIFHFCRAVKDELLSDERNVGNPYHGGTYKRSGKLGYEQDARPNTSMAYDEMEERGSQRGFHDRA